MVALGVGSPLFTSRRRRHFQLFPFIGTKLVSENVSLPKRGKIRGRATHSIIFFTQTREKTQEDISTATEEDAYELDEVISIQVSEDKNVHSQSETQTESETRPTKTDKMTSKQIATIFKWQKLHKWLEIKRNIIINVNLFAFVSRAQ